MAFYTQGILYCTYIYIGTVQVHIALLKFLHINSIRSAVWKLDAPGYGLLTVLRTTSHGRNVSGSNMKVASVSSSLATK